MTARELERANLDNLTSLWRRMGTRADAVLGRIGAHASRSWPHRWWLEPNRQTDVEEDSYLDDTLDDFVALVPPGSVVPVWLQNRGRFRAFETKLVEAGFVRDLDQTAMVLNLNEGASNNADGAAASALGELGSDARPSIALTPIEEGLDLAHPEGELACRSWSELCSRAFGYKINVEVIADIAADIDLGMYLARWEERAAGTALTWDHHGVVGIHQLGVAPEMRSRGIARTMTVRLLEICRASSARYVTLQASDAGAGIYRSLGFREQFTIRNYRRPRN